MNKKLAVVMAVSLLVASSALAKEPTPLAVGFGFEQGFSVLIQVDGNKNLAVGNDGIAFDYIFRKGEFEGSDFPFTWYVGAGGWVGWDHHSDEFGARLPLGLDWDFATNWDAYAQIHPQLKHKSKSNGLDLGMGAAVGVRYAF
ncbi:hypothetical protein [Vibrio algarum]|uniref:Outer membrane protein beta-barrel domain-containing protein n=1 Tax=Vibrio algarum TaxID=3020714 RepID=A0ABT4YSA4_9VIBR|nr:hypothetical protein [Vibrio sp. KJ40-1]MDB1124398.1 hypothetical protein [Vibrio sp. KJ40-1]